MLKPLGRLGTSVARNCFTAAVIATALSLSAANIATAATGDNAKRVALVVGNSDYAHAGRLRNPANDARDITSSLRRLGFEVAVALDLKQSDFTATLSNFRNQIAGADVALFYYSGHALQFRNENYLVSTDATLENEFALSGETINLKAVITAMESLVPTNLVFLDACRNNPLSGALQASLRKTNRDATVTRGLARIEAGTSDTLIGFAAGPGEVADDGVGRNSPYTHALLSHIEKPEIEISTLLKLVARDVRDATDGKQRPQSLADMASLFYFNDEPAIDVRPAASTQRPRPTPPSLGMLSDLPASFERPSQAEPSTCDALAADPDDPFALAPGVPLTALSPDAIPACRAASQNDATGRQLYQLGRALDAIGDAEAAFAEYLEASKAGYATALVALGRSLRDGSGVVRDPKLAARAFETASQVNIRRATTLLGLLHARGEGVKYDPVRAVELYRTASEQGDPVAMNNLAFMTENGRGTEEDAPAAAELYRRAAELGHRDAHYNLAWMYNDGRGVAADPAKAAEAFIAALSSGSDRLHDELVEGLDYLEDETLKQLQTQLADLGHYSGAIDGQFGRGSKAALRSFVSADR